MLSTLLPAVDTDEGWVVWVISLGLDPITQLFLAGGFVQGTDQAIQGSGVPAELLLCKERQPASSGSIWFSVLTHISQ